VAVVLIHVEQLGPRYFPGNNRSTPAAGPLDARRGRGAVGQGRASIHAAVLTWSMAAVPSARASHRSTRPWC
jgi:hypothetical protein